MIGTIIRLQVEENFELWSVFWTESWARFKEQLAALKDLEYSRWAGLMKIWQASRFKSASIIMDLIHKLISLFHIILCWSISANFIDLLIQTFMSPQIQLPACLQPFQLGSRKFCVSSEIPWVLLLTRVINSCI